MKTETTTTTTNQWPEKSEDYQAIAANALEWIVLFQSVLGELVELKRIKEMIESSKMPLNSLASEYDNRKPSAWKLAFEVIDMFKKDDGFINKPQYIKPDFISVAEQWQEWSVKAFPKASAVISLKKLKKELGELIDEIESDTPSPIQDEGIPLMEFADCFMCLLHSAAKEGFRPEQLVKAIANKAAANKKREWMQNPDGTYSHVK